MPEILLQYGYWPSSAIRPVGAFSVELLKFLNTLTVECAVSVKGFVQTLRWVHDLSAQEVSLNVIFATFQHLQKNEYVHYTACCHCK